jgi:hypothetical protein
MSFNELETFFKKEVELFCLQVHLFLYCSHMFLVLLFVIGDLSRTHNSNLGFQLSLQRVMLSQLNVEMS